MNEPKDVKESKPMNALSFLNSFEECRKSQTLVQDDTWFLLSTKWWAVAKAHLSKDVVDSNSNKCIMSNDDLLEDQDDEDVEDLQSTGVDQLWYPQLKPGLQAQRDYLLIPQVAWDLLKQRFKGGPAIRRKVITLGGYVKELKVEVYPFQLLVVYSAEPTKPHHIKCSQETSVKELKQKVCEQLELGAADKYILFNYFLSTKRNPLLESDSMYKAKLVNKQEVYLEEKGKQLKPVGTLKKSGETLEPSEPGIVGLRNLGNTCFMNSAIQCLINDPFLVPYFLNNSHKEDVNPTNPLGMKGKLAEQFHTLVKLFWRNPVKRMAPVDFKWTISQFAPRFSGMEQQDAQEFLSFLLDGLHEDLNRVKQKPYTTPIEANDRPDAQVALESWYLHLKRNQSIVVDLFQGQFKSTVTCPHCNKVSVTFDPMMYLTLPLPDKNTKNIRITLVHKTGETPQIFHIAAPKKGHIHDLKTALSLKSDSDPKSLIITEIHQNKIYRLYTDQEPISEIQPMDTIFAFVMNDPSPNIALVDTVFLQVSQQTYKPKPVTVETGTRVYWPTHSIKRHPFFISIHKKAVTYTSLKANIVNKILHSVESVPALGGASSKISDIKSCLHDAISLHLSDTRDGSIRILEDLPNLIKGISGHHTLIALWDMKLIKNKYFKFKEYLVCTTKDDKIEEVNILDCLKLFVAQEKLGKGDEWRCPTCKEDRQATKKMDIWELPNVLVIHFKRFAFQNFWRTKIDTPIQFPIKGLDLSEFCLSGTTGVYDLHAVINHYGSAGGGHYTAYANNSTQDKWFCFDDANVYPIKEAEVVSNASSYVCFYHKRSFKLENKTTT